MKQFVVTCEMEGHTLWYELDAEDAATAEKRVREHDPDIEKILEVREADVVDINDYEPAEGSEG